MPQPIQKRTGRYFIWRVARPFLIALAIFIPGVMLFEEKLIYFPLRYPAGEWQPAGLNFEDANFEAADGVKLHGWFVPCQGAKAVVLLAHGNAGNVTNRAELLRELHAAKVATLVFDYRGYGRSDDRQPNEAGILQDARAARSWLAERTGLPEKHLVMMGESLGGGVAVDLAAKDGARGLVLINTFSSLPDVASQHYPFLPARLLMRNRLDSASKIGSFHGPLLQTHGDDDHTVPFWSGEKLFAAANEPKQFVRVAGGDHNDGVDGEFFAALSKFLNQLPAE